MPSFNNLKDLEKYLQSNLTNMLFDSMDVVKVLADTMSQSVKDIVYGAYDPVEYKRRGLEGGLADPRNGIISSVYLKEGNIIAVFENVTLGQTHDIPIYEQPKDSLDGDYISGTIENGKKENWYQEGKWSKPRPFMKETANRIKSNPNELIQAFKKEMKNRGFKVK